MTTIIAVLLFLFLLPGIIIHFRSIRYLKKWGEKQDLWASFHPIIILFSIIIGIPFLSFGFYEFLFISPLERATMLDILASDKEASLYEKSLYYAMAETFGINLE